MYSSSNKKPARKAPNQRHVSPSLEPNQPPTSQGFIHVQSPGYQFPNRRDEPWPLPLGSDHNVMPMENQQRFWMNTSFGPENHWSSLPTATEFHSGMLNSNPLLYLNMNNINLNSNQNTPAYAIAKGFQNFPAGNATNVMSNQHLFPPAATGYQNFMDTGMNQGLNMSMNQGLNTGMMNTGLNTSMNQGMNTVTNTVTNTDMNVYMNYPHHAAVSTGLQHAMNFPQITFTSPRSRMSTWPHSQLPRAEFITSASRAVQNTQSHVSRPHHQGPTRIKKKRGGGALSISGRLKDCPPFNHSFMINMDSGTPSITPQQKALRAAAKAADADGDLLVAQGVVLNPIPSDNSQDSPQGSQQPDQQPEIEEKIAPGIQPEQLLNLLADRHWEYWHRLNNVHLEELAAENQANSSVREAWHRRLSNRSLIDGYMRVYELGGFLYEVTMTPEGQLYPAVPIPWREYAGSEYSPLCCQSINHAQALVNLQERARGNIPANIQGLSDAQAEAEPLFAGHSGPDWQGLLRTARDKGNL